MKTINKNIALLLVWLIASQPLLAAVPAGSVSIPQAQSAEMLTNTRSGSPPQQEQGVELTGNYNDRTAEIRAEMLKDHKQGMAEDGSPMATSPIADLPVVDTKLAQRASTAKADEYIRVLIHLDYLPHGDVLRDTMRQFEDEVNAVEEARVSLLNQLEANRSRDTKYDSEDYANMFAMADDQRVALRALNEQNEAVSLQIKESVTSQLRGVINQSQKPINEEIVRLGGIVEFGTIANNTIVALIPASAIEALGKTPGILRMVEDSIMEGHLNVADTSTMVDPADASLFGLWDSFNDGGIYDPAIIDSGLDLSHPAMANSVSPLRENFGSWYVVAGFGSASWNDLFTLDDLQGHGTHVAGIVGSYGSAGYTQNLGMAHGVDKLVNLKAGWRNTAGTASMFWSDKYNLVDRALYNTAGLQPNDFNDDVDGMNLSYGGSTSLDDTDGGRFWDSVISTYPDLPVTISAGNSGPSNTLFSDPAVSHNAITVANAYDLGTTSRNDDIIYSGSTKGPTSNNRRKPDLAAPGTSISAPNHNWEGFSADHVNKTGTSMAAPMVLGIIMDLNDAGLFDDLSVKALLINTAQKNLPGMNIEGDSDGWDPQVGWGMVNAFAAYFHRTDIFVDSVAPRSTAGDYQLYRGSMRDEGASGEGRDRATMAWHRSATYLADSDPTTYYSLSDLNLRLYAEENNALLSLDLDGNDNVHQVRVPAGSPDTDVVITAYAWSTAFANGNTTQSYALATEDGFTRAERPSTFQGVAVWPVSVEPNEVFTIEFWLRNDSELASHQNQLEFLGTNGFTLVGGSTFTNIGSIAGGGTNSAHTIYQVKAPPTAVGTVNIVVAHSHNSYNVPYGDFNWNMGTTVEVDNTPPSPSPMGFSVSPIAQSTSAITMTASFANDVHNDPIQYYLDYTSSPSGGAFANDSGWQNDRAYTDTGLQTNDQYCYRAWARDSAVGLNQTTPSAIECVYTFQSVASPVAATAVTTSTITVQPQGVLNNLTLDLSGLKIDEIATGQSTGWVQSTAPFTIVGLAAAATHKFEATARNGDGIVSGVSDSTTVYTLANPPAANSVSALSETAINVSILANGNSEAQFQIQNTTTGDSSGWMAGLTWASSGLNCATSYNFQARARNQDGFETIIVPLGSVSTLDCTVDTDSDGIDDSADNCTLISNADQRDTNGDGYGNACDPDLNNDGTVNFVDISLFGAVFPSSGANLDEDFNGDNLVNFVDYVLFSTFFLDPPGPSGVAP